MFQLPHSPSPYMDETIASWFRRLAYEYKQDARQFLNTLQLYVPALKVSRVDNLMETHSMRLLENICRLSKGMLTSKKYDGAWLRDRYSIGGGCYMCFLEDVSRSRMPYERMVWCTPTCVVCPNHNQPILSVPNWRDIFDANAGKMFVDQRSLITSPVGHFQFGAFSANVNYSRPPEVEILGDVFRSVSRVLQIRAQSIMEYLASFYPIPINTNEEMWRTVYSVEGVGHRPKGIRLLQVNASHSFRRFLIMSAGMLVWLIYDGKSKDIGELMSMSELYRLRSASKNWSFHQVQKIASAFRSAFSLNLGLKNDRF